MEPCVLHKARSLALSCTLSDISSCVSYSVPLGLVWDSNQSNPKDFLPFHLISAFPPRLNKTAPNEPEGRAVLAPNLRWDRAES